MGGFLTCSADGTIFLEVTDAQSDHMGLLALHSLAPSGESVRFSPGRVPGYDQITQPLRFFAGEARVAALVYATPAKKSLTDSTPDPVMLGLIYDRKGALQKAVRLPDNTQTTALGIYGSGDLLAVEVNIQDKTARLMVLGPDGDSIRELRLFDDDYNLSKTAKEDQMLSGVKQNKWGALATMMTVPYGEDLLLISVYTRQPVIEVNEHGIVRVYPLQIPKGLYLDTPLSISRNGWTFAMSGGGRDHPNEEDTPQAFVIKPGPVLIFNPSDGSARRRIEKSANDQRAVLACEHDGEYTALTTSREDGSLQVLKATIPQ
jgi:hypothetical protein